MSQHDEAARPYTCIDAFCGMGGFSTGFAQVGFTVRGFDIDRHAVESYRANVGDAELVDIRSAVVPPTNVVIGGPPCRPWSVLNVTRRGSLHPDYSLVAYFRELLLRSHPDVFIMENVPGLRKDSAFDEFLIRMRAAEFDCEARVIDYSHFGAASTRKRLFTVGARHANAAAIWEAVDDYKVALPRTVGIAIGKYSRPENGRPFPDHVWPKFRTIANYDAKYTSGKFGWYRLRMDQTAPSFGNITKTYVLHPFGDNGDSRVLSPREAMAILGFGDDYVFPESVPLGAKYRMVADAVSPLVSAVLARAIVDAAAFRCETTSAP